MHLNDEFQNRCLSAESPTHGPLSDQHIRFTPGVWIRIENNRHRCTLRCAQFVTQQQTACKNHFCSIMRAHPVMFHFSFPPGACSTHNTIRAPYGQTLAFVHRQRDTDTHAHNVTTCCRRSFDGWLCSAVNRSHNKCTEPIMQMMPLLGAAESSVRSCNQFYVKYTHVERTWNAVEHRNCVGHRESCIRIQPHHRSAFWPELNMPTSSFARTFSANNHSQRCEYSREFAKCTRTQHANWYFPSILLRSDMVCKLVNNGSHMIFVQSCPEFGVDYNVSTTASVTSNVSILLSSS